MRRSYLWGALVLVLAAVALLVVSHERLPQQQVTSPQTETPSSSSATSTPVATPAAPSSTAPSVPAKAASSTTAAQAPAGATATLVVDGARFPLHAPTGSTLKAAMDQLQQEGGFTYAYKEYPGMGSFVTSINGLASTNEYWILYVNGKQSDTGISSTHIRSGDVIEWKLEKSY